MPSPTGLGEFLPFCFTKRVNSPKALPYSFSPYVRCLSEKKRKKDIG